MLSKIIKVELNLASRDEIDNTYQDFGQFGISCTKTKFNNCFVIHCNIVLTLSTNNDLSYKTTFASQKKQ